MFRVLFLVVLLLVCPEVSRASDAPETATSWRPAVPGYTYGFPADHASHPDHKTEWWYFTGSVRAENGREFGYELTWFRQGTTPPGRLAAERSRFIQSDFKFAHLAVTDLGAGQFHFTQRLARGGFGEAGFGPAPGTAAPGGGEGRLAWIDGWELTPEGDDGGTWHLKAAASRPGEPAMALDLRVNPRKAPVEHGLEGVSAKADGAGNASHYYSFTRLETSGTLAVGGKTFNVRGNSWFDHEWASNKLGPDEVGWDWFCFQFDDGTEAMLYAMRRRDGSIDPVSGGTFVDVNGQATHLTRADFELTRTRTWKSAKTGAEYPLGWKVRLPGRGLEWEVTARLDDQELALPPVAYWEGAIAVRGTGPGGKPLTGHGYMELTGYAGALAGLSPSAPAPARGAGEPAGAGPGPALYTGSETKPDTKHIMIKRTLALAALGFATLAASPARAELKAGANLAPYEIKNTATGEQYCQMCQYGSKPATVAAYGKFEDAAFWSDLKTLQAYHEKFPQAGFFAQVLDSTDAKAIQAKAKAQGITFPVVYAADKDWNSIYKVDASRTVYVSRNFKVVYSTVGLDGKPSTELEARLKSELKG